MGRASRRRAERRNAPPAAPRPDAAPGVVVLDRYLIRPATLDDDAEAVRALLEPVDFMDAAVPEEIVDRMRTGWRLPAQYGTATRDRSRMIPPSPPTARTTTMWHPKDRMASTDY